jgi:uncharacterized SAM-dependent methyltransferase
MTTKRKKEGPSQLMELFLHVAELLGYTSDKDVAELAGVSPENVANWRSGAVQEFKPQKLKGIKANITAQLEAMSEQAGAVKQGTQLSPIEIEEGSSPSELQRQFRDRVAYDYLGHRFLYYEPMGALAWEKLIGRGYEQASWLTGVESCADAWLDLTRDENGRTKGPIADSVGLSRRGAPRGLDLVSLGPGEGEKELLLLKKLLELEKQADQRLPWLCYGPVDVSIPLLVRACIGAQKLLGEEGHSSGSKSRHRVKSFCADFEEGNLSFLDRLPSTLQKERGGTRLVLMLGNVFGNLRDEETFVRDKLWKIARSGDLVWIEVGLRLEPIDKDPLYSLTIGDREMTSAEANRRLLLEGPYRRWEAATGRKPSEVEMRIWMREDDDSTRVPGSINFCHDLVLQEERRACTMLYSRRYQLENLTSWLEQLDFSVVRIKKVEDSQKRARVGHVLLLRR